MSNSLHVDTYISTSINLPGIHWGLSPSPPPQPQTGGAQTSLASLCWHITRAAVVSDLLDEAYKKCSPFLCYCMASRHASQPKTSSIIVRKVGMAVRKKHIEL